MVVCGQRVSLVTLGTLILPRIYEVSASLLVNEARAEVPLAPTESQQLIINQVTEQDVNSEIEVLRSRTLVEGVLRVAERGRRRAAEAGLIGVCVGHLRDLLTGKREAVEELIIAVQENLEIDPRFASRT